MRDAYQEHMESRAGILSSRKAIGWRNGHDYSGMWRERPSQAELLDEPKYGISDDLEALQQVFAAAFEAYKIHTGSQIVERGRAC